MFYVPAKSILNRSKNNENWFGYDYNMNIYKGCCHGCIYCDSRSECYGVVEFDKVRAKENALLMLEEELGSKRSKGVIGTGAMSDPYNKYEEEYRLTRGALEIIDKHRFGITTITKSSLITRDIDMYQRIAHHSPICLKVTITTFEDDMCRRLEPNVAPTSERLRAIKELSQAGLFTGILLMPLLPYINDSVENVSAIVIAAAEAGVKFIYPAFGVTLRQNQRVYFMNKIKELFPGAVELYEKNYRTSYQCTSPNEKELIRTFTELCKKYGILYRMKDIISAYRPQRIEEQLSFI